MYNRKVRSRFWDKVAFSLNGGCWNWEAAKFSNGYGHFVVGKGTGYNKLAHRVSYEIYFGRIKMGMVIHHKCGNKSCVNPNHLELVTKRENTLRGNNPAALNNRKTHCVHGHELAGNNLYVWRNGRYCKKCRCAVMARHRHGIAAALLYRAYQWQGDSNE